MRVSSSGSKNVRSIARDLTTQLRCDYPVTSIPSTSPSKSSINKFKKTLEINQCVLKSEKGMSIGKSLSNDNVSVGKKIYTSLFYASHAPGWSSSTALAVCQINTPDIFRRL